MASMIHNRYASTKFDWIINDFSKVVKNTDEGLYSDVFSVGGFDWQLQIYPMWCGEECEYLPTYLIPVDSSLDWNNFPIPEFSAKVLNLLDPDQSWDETPDESAIKDFEKKFKNWRLKHKDIEGKIVGFINIGGLHDPDSKGCIVNDTCVLRVEVSCRMIDDVFNEDTNERNPEKVIQLGEYPGAGQPFGEEQTNNKLSFGEDKEEFGDIGGFPVLKTQAPLYRQIWLKYGHIPSTKVIPVASYPILVMAVKDLMCSITDMHKCPYVDLSSELIERWEDMITMAEKLEFNIGWLRERFEHVRKGMCGMQSFKTELLEHSQHLRSTKLKMRVLRSVMSKAEVQLIAAKDDMRGKISGLLSESDMETYLEIGEDLLLDGLLDGIY